MPSCSVLKMKTIIKVTTALSVGNILLNSWLIEYINIVSRALLLCVEYDNNSKITTTLCLRYFTKFITICVENMQLNVSIWLIMPSCSGMKITKIPKVATSNGSAVNWSWLRSWINYRSMESGRILSVANSLSVKNLGSSSGTPTKILFRFRVTRRRERSWSVFSKRLLTIQTILDVQVNCFEKWTIKLITVMIEYTLWQHLKVKSYFFGCPLTVTDTCLFR